MARIGAPFEVDSIDTHIEATAYTYAHKTGERFGFREYPSLNAKIKDTEAVGKSEIRALRPMLNTAAVPKRSMMVAGRSLEIGQHYRLIGDETPLMPSHTADGLEGLAGMVYLPIGEVVTVIGMVSQRDTPWYHVSLPARDAREGWINSIALLGDGVYQLSDNDPATSTATITATPKREELDYRAEVLTQVIDPCTREIAAITMPSFPVEQGTEFLKKMLADFLSAQADSMAEEVTGLDAATRAMFYRVGLEQCVAAANSQN